MGIKQSKPITLNVGIDMKATVYGRSISITRNDVRVVDLDLHGLSRKALISKKSLKTMLVLAMRALNIPVIVSSHDDDRTTSVEKDVTGNYVFVVTDMYNNEPIYGRFNYIKHFHLGEKTNKAMSTRKSDKVQDEQHLDKVLRIERNL